MDYHGQGTSFGAQGGVGGSLNLVKTTDTEYTTTVVEGDPHLTTQVAANSVYAIDMVLHHTGSTAGDGKFAISAPVNAVLRASTDLDAENATPIEALDEEVFSCNGVNVPRQLHLKGVLRTTDAGEFSVLFGQNLDSVTPVTILEGSYVILTKLK